MFLSIILVLHLQIFRLKPLESESYSFCLIFNSSPRHILIASALKFLNETSFIFKLSLYLNFCFNSQIFTQDLFELFELEFLSVSDNEIREIPVELAKLSNLEHLDVSKNSWFLNCLLLGILIIHLKMRFKVYF